MTMEILTLTEMVKNHGLLAMLVVVGVYLLLRGEITFTYPRRKPTKRTGKNQ